MSSSDADFIAYINNISSGLNRYFSVFIFLVGTLGNILNVLVLSGRGIRKKLLCNAIPILLMFIFALMTMKNVRQSRRQIQAGNVSTMNNVGRTKENQGNKNDAHLLRMLFVQVILLFIFSLPLGMEK
ncbi:unnamed protein product [Rotaria magnacalcarata]|uniref:G-protein coupled receptors family 1 profile domain-containing protein n=1 Tax=Rotaria magnacalcarata TaxID=392030 RepID=A0A816K9Y6_9BILA|nr:unnamed protein product [Rotaria magnacalcarata]